MSEATKLNAPSLIPIVGQATTPKFHGRETLVLWLGLLWAPYVVVFCNFVLVSLNI